MHERKCSGAFRTLMPIVLASGSPRRRDFLCSLGLYFDVICSDVEEPAPDAGQKPLDYALSIAMLKGEAVARQKPDKAIISADTIVVKDEKILGKPVSRQDAVSMLKFLRAQTHEVISACWLFLPEKQPLSFAVSSNVTFADVSDDALNAYVATGEPMDKAGAYAIQGTGAFLVKSIQGSYTNVVGLPVAELVAMLIEYEVIEPNI